MTEGAADPDEAAAPADTAPADTAPADTAPADTAPAEADATDPVPVLREPRDGTPEPLTDPIALERLATALRTGDGPLAVDAERASGYRYTQRAYLVQLRRDGVGTALIDPIELPVLDTLNDALGDTEWILHAASQDLSCLADLGLRPARLFDTELAGRLLGDERVALATMCEKHLGIGLEKGHSAADWSTRPLPHDWLVYAALDVELLVPLRDALADALADAGKIEWARQEFDAVRLAPPALPRVEPWRRTSGIHVLRHRRQLAAVRALWEARDARAAERDLAPGRVLPDAAIISAARANPNHRGELIRLPVFGGPRQRRQANYWFGALEDARALGDGELPLLTSGSGDGMPAPSRWRERDPAAAERLAAVRTAVTAVAEQHTVLTQNLLASDIVRRLCWSPPPRTTAAAVGDQLAELGARPWQVELTATPIAAALGE